MSVTVPWRRVKGPGPFLDDDQHTDQLQRCIRDTALPLDVRVCGALMLLYGVSLPSIVGLTIDAVDQCGGEVYLTLGDKPVQLPPRVAELVWQLLNQQRDPSAVSCATGPTRFLFPGMIAGRPSNAVAFACKLNRHGIAASALATPPALRWQQSSQLR